MALRDTDLLNACVSEVTGRILAPVRDRSESVVTNVVKVRLNIVQPFF